MAVVRAAGGLLWREGPTGPRLALVHRPRRDDWSLPKGKLDEGESWEAAALREVEEETGCEARITGFAGATSYLAKRAPKLVLYWHMALVREGRLDAGDEIDEVAWLAPDAALRRLDHELDRRLVARAPPPGPPPARPGPFSADAAAERAELLRRVLALGPKAEGVGLGPALELVDLADDAAARGDAAGARALVLAARRLALLSAEEPERSLRALALREEARDLAPWRRRAVRRLLPRGGRISAEALHVATALRDEARSEAGASLGGGVAGAVGLVGVLALAGLAAAIRSPGGAALAGGAAGLAAGAAAALGVLAVARRRRSGR